jgi:hypothetical protein
MAKGNGSTDAASLKPKNHEAGWIRTGKKAGTDAPGAPVKHPADGNKKHLK